MSHAFEPTAFEPTAFATELTPIPFPAPGDPNYFDRALRMLERLPFQFRSKTDNDNNIQKLLKALAPPFQEFEKAYQQVLRQRDIQTAIEKQLDDLGKIVLEKRSGLLDDLYRLRIRAKIAVNKSKGRVNDLIRIAELVLLDVPGAVIRVIPQTIATVVVRIEGVVVTGQMKEVVLLEYLTRGAAAGVRLILESGQSQPANWFIWDSTDPNQTWDAGHFIEGTTLSLS